MNAQSMVVVTLVLWMLLAFLFKLFFDKKISSGQTLFWLVPLLVAQVLVLFPALVDGLSALWGNLVPVSWITFLSMSLTIAYLLYLTIRVNRYSRVVELARSVAYLERRLRQTESRCEELADQLAHSE